MQNFFKFSLLSGVLKRLPLIFVSSTYEVDDRLWNEYTPLGSSNVGVEEGKRWAQIENKLITAGGDDVNWKISSN